MAVKARIFAGLFLVCIILPSLASAFVDHLPHVVQANDNNDVPIHLNNVAHFNKKHVRKHASNDHTKKVVPAPVNPTPNPVPVNPVPNPVPINPVPNPVPVNPVPNPKPVPNPVPVNPVPNPVPVNPVPNPVPVNSVPVNPVPVNPVPVNPVPNPVPVNPVPNPVPVDPKLPAGYPGANQAPVTIGYGGAPITPNPSDQQPEQSPATQNHPTPKEIIEHRKRAGLQVGFYSDTCPNAEKIIKDGMTRAFGNDSNMAAPIPRLLLHDCFVNGCDASILLDQTPSGAKIEKVATSNGPTVRGYDLIDEIKAQLEAACPGIVSCSDLLAYLARDAFVVSGVPHYDVPGGRRDGMESLEANVYGNLPLPDFTVDKMIDLFHKKGLTEEDLVVLIGAHSIGVAHCFSFRYRVDDPQKATMMDPRLTSVMKFACTNPTSTLPFDSTTQYKMDAIYYKQLAAKRGLLESDGLLSEDPRTKGFVQKFGEDEKGWLRKLGKAMNKLASIQVLTGDQGQIRKNCRAVN